MQPLRPEGVCVKYSLAILSVSVFHKKVYSAWALPLDKHAVVLTLKIPVSNTSAFKPMLCKSFLLKYWSPKRLE